MLEVDNLTLATRMNADIRTMIERMENHSKYQVMVNRNIFYDMSKIIHKDLSSFSRKCKERQNHGLFEVAVMRVHNSQHRYFYHGGSTSNHYF